MRPVTLETFEAQVLKTSHERPVLVMFTSPTCGPCKVMKPLVAHIAAENGFEFAFEVDAMQVRMLCARYAIRMVPTMLIFEKGEVTRTHAGAGTEKQIHDFLGSRTLGWAPFFLDPKCT